MDHDEYIDIVDNMDNVVDVVRRPQIYNANITHRVVMIVAINPDGQIFIGKRTTNRLHYPGRLQVVGGIVQTGQDYNTAAQQELEEELGLRQELMPLGIVRQRTETDNSNIAVYVCKYIDPLKVTEAEFVNSENMVDEQVLTTLQNKPSDLTPATKIALEEYFKKIRTFKTRAPGKIFIAGEWAVLEPGNPAIVGAIDKHVDVIIKESTSSKFDLSIVDFGIQGVSASWDGNNLSLDKQDNEHLIFMKTAIEVVGKFLGGLKPFSLKTNGENMLHNLNGSTMKLGLGSSAAATISMISAILRFHGFDIEDKLEEIFKLGMITNFLAQKKLGSGFDIAASTFGGLFAYERFDPDWLLSQLDSTPYADLVNKSWKKLSINPLSIHDEMEFVIGWTGSSASTPNMINKFNSWRDSYRHRYDFHFKSIANLVRNLITHWQEGNFEHITELISKNHQLLSALGQDAGIPIEVPQLRKLSAIASKHNAGGKLSGAGGGDIGFALTFDKNSKEKIIRDWRKAGIIHIEANIAHNGVHSLF